MNDAVAGLSNLKHELDADVLSAADIVASDTIAFLEDGELFNEIYNVVVGELQYVGDLISSGSQTAGNDISTYGCAAGQAMGIGSGLTCSAAQAVATAVSTVGTLTGQAIADIVPGAVSAVTDVVNAAETAYNTAASTATSAVFAAGNFLSGMLYCTQCTLFIHYLITS